MSVGLNIILSSMVRLVIKPCILLIFFAGRPCNENGDFIPEGSPPPPRSTSGSTPGSLDWDPFANQLQFETADFLFRRAQLSATKIDSLLDLWAASLIKHNDTPPFTNVSQLYDAIDSVKTGGQPWRSFEVRYTGEIPEADAPEWMHATYEVWYRDPTRVLADFLANPDFKDEWDPSPLREYDESGQRVWRNLMSGNWAWTQCVRGFTLKPCVFTLKPINRTASLLMTRPQKVACSVRLYWAATRRRYPLQPARTSTTHYMHP
jgi:hypothetical protein